MPSPGIDTIKAQLDQYKDGGGLGLEGAVSLQATIGRLARVIDRDYKRRQQIASLVTAFPLPAQQYQVAGGALVAPTFIADAMSPKDGYIWFVTRLSVAGLVAEGGTAQANEGTVTSPGGNTVIVTITPPAPGEYIVNWSVELAGTPAAADANNFQLKYPTGTSLQVSENQGAVGGPWPQPAYGPMVVTATGGPINIRTVGAATTGAIYTAQLSLVPVADDQVTLYRGIGVGITAQPQNQLRVLSAPGGSPGPDWSPGGPGALLNHQDCLLLAGSNLAASLVTLSADVIQLPPDLLAEYVL